MGAHHIAYLISAENEPNDFCMNRTIENVDVFPDAFVNEIFPQSSKSVLKPLTHAEDGFIELGVAKYAYSPTPALNEYVPLLEEANLELLNPRIHAEVYPLDGCVALPQYTLCKKEILLVAVALFSPSDTANVNVLLDEIAVE